MTRTFILFVLVLLAAAYVAKMKYLGPRNDLAAAKERIRRVHLQPPDRPDSTSSRRAAVPADRAANPVPRQEEPSRQDATSPDAPTDENDRVTHLIKGTFNIVDGTIIYSADAQLDIGHGMVVSSPTGVMVSDEEQQHISGDLVIETAEARTSMENAFLTLDKTHVVMTSDSSTTVKKEGPN